MISSNYFVFNWKDLTSLLMTTLKFIMTYGPPHVIIDNGEFWLPSIGFAMQLHTLQRRLNIHAIMTSFY